MKKDSVSAAAANASTSSSAGVAAGSYAHARNAGNQASTWCAAFAGTGPSGWFYRVRIRAAIAVRSGTRGDACPCQPRSWRGDLRTVLRDGAEPDGPGDPRSKAELRCAQRRAPSLRRPAAGPCANGAAASSLPPSLRGQVVTTPYVAGPTTRKPAWLAGFRNPAPNERKVPESAGARKGGVFRARQESTTTDIRPCAQGGIGCPVSGARAQFARR